MSFIKIPRHYDVIINAGYIDIVCTNHPKPQILRTVVKGFIGVDAIMILIETHEEIHH